MKQIMKTMKQKGWLALAMVAVVVIGTVIVPVMGARAASYNYQTACDYANRWGGSNRNPDYYDYSNSGGDCMNYVSQCLAAGGLNTGSDWRVGTTSWVNVPTFVSTMQARGYQVIENPNAGQILPGNPVIYWWYGSSSWSHATICVGYNGNGTPVINGHTGDRYQVSWNYAQSSALKMCTILINRGEVPAPPLGEEVNLGDEFYAEIVSVCAEKPLTVDGSNVVVKTEASDSDALKAQVWKFTRRSDGYYSIVNYMNNLGLDVYGAAGSSETNVGVWEQNTTGAQRWHIYKDGDYYRLTTDCTNCVLDVYGGGKSPDGTNVEMYEYNTSSAQKFTFKMIGVPSQSELSVVPGTSTTPTVLTWTKSRGADIYNIRINGSLKHDEWNYTGTSYEIVLPAGDYEVYVDACSQYYYLASNKVSFKVEEGQATETAEDSTEANAPTEDTLEAGAAEDSTEANVSGEDTLEAGAAEDSTEANIPGEDTLEAGAAEDSTEANAPTEDTLEAGAAEDTAETGASAGENTENTQHESNSTDLLDEDEAQTVVPVQKYNFFTNIYNIFFGKQVNYYGITVENGSNVTDAMEASVQSTESIVQDQAAEDVSFETQQEVQKEEEHEGKTLQSNSVGYDGQTENNGLAIDNIVNDEGQTTEREGTVEDIADHDGQTKENELEDSITTIHEEQASWSSSEGNSTQISVSRNDGNNSQIRPESMTIMDLSGTQTYANSTLRSTGTDAMQGTGANASQTADNYEQMVSGGQNIVEYVEAEPAYSAENTSAEQNHAESGQVGLRLVPSFDDNGNLNGLILRIVLPGSSLQNYDIRIL